MVASYSQMTRVISSYLPKDCTIACTPTPLVPSICYNAIEMKKPLFIAHRGAWDPQRRENTAAAVERAAASGRFAYIELDVRRTRADDNALQTPILLHDETLDRLYDLYRIPKSKQHRRGQAVYGLTLDIIRGEEVDISTLQEAMRAANGHPLNLEIKSDQAIEPVLEVLSDMIDKYKEWDWEKIVISSFDWEILYQVRERIPEVGIAMLYGIKNVPKSFGRHYHTLDARWIKFNKWLTPLCVPLAMAFGIKDRHVYTVNSVLTVQFLRLFGVVGFTTDKITLPDKFTSV